MHDLKRYDAYGIRGNDFKLKIELIHIFVATDNWEAAQFASFIKWSEIMEQKTLENNVKVNKQRTNQRNLPQATHELQA